MVYVLRSVGNTHYIGCTANLPNRLAAHKSGKVYSTAKLGDTKRLALVHCWEVPTTTDGAKLEHLMWRQYKEGRLLRAIDKHPHWSLKLQTACAELKLTSYEKTVSYLSQGPEMKKTPTPAGQTPPTDSNPTRQRHQMGVPKGKK